mmetsp:Transcript_3383/g.11732  ORF Transcript_3383/g.11732 Transcript_3383/m.11732 type:complete len:257 (+) Transcript_3383:341-1111(+)
MQLLQTAGPKARSKCDARLEHGLERPLWVLHDRRGAARCGGHASAALLRVDGASHSSEGGRSTAAAISREAEAEQLPAESTALQHEPLAASGRTSGGGGARAQHRVHGELTRARKTSLAAAERRQLSLAPLPPAPRPTSIQAAPENDAPSPSKPPPTAAASTASKCASRLRSSAASSRPLSSAAAAASYRVSAAERAPGASSARAAPPPPAINTKTAGGASCPPGGTAGSMAPVRTTASTSALCSKRWCGAARRRA